VFCPSTQDINRLFSVTTDYFDKGTAFASTEAAELVIKDQTRGYAQVPGVTDFSPSGF
jgi:hypothetical protein